MRIVLELIDSFVEQYEEMLEDNKNLLTPFSEEYHKGYLEGIKVVRNTIEEISI